MGLPGVSIDAGVNLPGGGHGLGPAFEGDYGDSTSVVGYGGREQSPPIHSLNKAEALRTTQSPLPVLR